jgi:hypothetical protein
MGPGETNRKEIKENHGVQYQNSPTLKDGTGKKNSRTNLLSLS